MGQGRCAYVATWMGWIAAAAAWAPLASAQQRAAAATSFRPYADGYWVLGTYDEPSRHHRDIADALNDATARWCKQQGNKDCRWTHSSEMESTYSNDRYVRTHIEYDLRFRYDFDPPNRPFRTLHVGDNSRVRIARSCPAGYALTTWFGFREENASLSSVYDEFTCRADDAQPTDRQLGAPSFDAIGTCDGTSALVGNPINVATNNKVQVVTDFPSAGASPLQWTRYYNSGGFAGWDRDWRVLPQRRFLGSQWRGSYDANLEATWWYDALAGKYQPALKRHRPDGATTVYEWHEDHYVSAADDPARIEAMPAAQGGGWRYTDEDDNVERYDADGRLLSLADRHGRTQVLHYSDATTPASIAHGVTGKLIAVSDAQRRSLSFTYDVAGRIATVTDPTGAALRYRYDEADGSGLDADLVEVTYADGRSEGYRYRDTRGDPKLHSLTGVIDAAGKRYATYFYTNGGRAVGSEHAEGAGKVMASVPNPVGYVSDARGTTRQYVFDTVQGLRRVARLDQPEGAGCPSSSRKLVYDDAGHVVSRTDNHGHTTAYRHSGDGRGLETMRMEALGTPQERTILTDWHPRFRLPVRIQTLPTGAQGDSAAAALTLSFDYDDRGRLLTRTQTAEHAAEPRRWSYTYDEAGRVIAADGPRTDVADVTRYAYRQQDADGCTADPTHCAYRRGDLWTVTDPLGHVTEILRYDGAGRPLAVRDPNGVATDLVYTPRGWLAELRVHGATEAVTRYDYDVNGQLAKSTDPDGVTLSYAYDAAHRLTAIRDAAGGQIDFTLNAAGDVVAEVRRGKEGQAVRSLARTFDALGRMQTSTEADGQRTSFEYDAHGNLTQVTRPLGQVWRIQHDALDRVVRQVGDARGLSATVEHAHDSRDALTAIVDPKGLTTHYERNGLGDLLEQRSPDTGTTTQVMDAAGNVVRRTDARGQTRRMRYDAVQRLLEISFDGAPAETTRYTYDQADASCPAGETYAVGRLSRIADASGSTSYCYNASGQLARKRQTVAGTTLELAYTYTPAGRLASVRYPDGHIAAYTRDANGRIAAIDVVSSAGLRQPLVKDATYLPFGPVAQWRYGLGRTLTRRYDADGRPLSVEDHAAGGLAASFGYDANGRLTRLDVSGLPQLAFAYDALDHLVETRDGAAGTVLERYRYDLTGNRTSFADAKGEQPYVYPKDWYAPDSVDT